MNVRNLLPLLVSTIVLALVLGGTFLFRSRSGPVTGDDRDAGSVEATFAAPPVPSPASRTGRTQLQSAPDMAREQVQEHVEQRARMRKEHMARNRELRERSAARFAKEPVDPTWAAAKESELVEIANREAFGQADARPTSLSMDCRTSMCRLQGEFGTQGQAEDWIMMYMASVGGAMPHSVVSRTQNPDGSARVEIYGSAR